MSFPLRVKAKKITFPFLSGLPSFTVSIPTSNNLTETVPHGVLSGLCISLFQMQAN